MPVRTEVSAFHTFSWACLPSLAIGLGWFAFIGCIGLGWFGLDFVHPLYGSFIGTEVGVRWILPEATWGSPVLAVLTWTTPAPYTAFLCQWQKSKKVFGVLGNLRPKKCEGLTNGRSLEPTCWSARFWSILCTWAWTSAKKEEISQFLNQNSVQMPATIIKIFLSLQLSSMRDSRCWRQCFPILNLWSQHLE